MMQQAPQPYQPLHYAPQQVQYDTSSALLQPVPDEEHHHHHHEHHPLTKEEIKHAIVSRDYQIAITTWIGEAWGVYKSCWWGFTVSFILLILLGFIPYVQVVSILFYYCIINSWFVASVNSLRSGTPAKFREIMFGAFYSLLWIILQSIIIRFFVILGLILLIIPGIMLSVLFTFSVNVFLEYRSCGINIIEAMSISAKVTWKRFFWMLWFNIAMGLLAISGLLALGVGLFVTVPLASITYALAFRELFGLNIYENNEAV